MLKKQILTTLIVLVATLVEAQNNSALFYYQNFEYQQAAALWEKDANKLSRADQEHLLECYLNTQQGEKGLKLVDQMRAEKPAEQLTYFAAQFAFQVGLYDRALSEAKTSRAINPSALPLLFEENCKLASSSIRSIDGNETVASGNTKSAEIYLETADEAILLKEMGYDSLLNLAATSGNFEEVFFLRPHLLTNGAWTEWKAISDAYPHYSMGSIQIDKAHQKAYFSASQPLQQAENAVHSLAYQATFNGFDQPLSNVELLTIEGLSGSMGHLALSPDNRYLIITNYAADDSSSNFILLENTDQTWKNPRLMTEINTAGDEMFPSFHEGNVLRFSSNGRPGFGDLDVYQADFNNGKASNIQHLEQPINGLADDFLVYGTLYDTLTFSSNRASGIGDDDTWNYFPKPVVVAIEEKVVPVLPAIVVKAQRLYFDYRASTTTQKAKDIDQLRLALERSPEKMVVVTGNADPRGTDEYNVALAMLRAVYVKNELIKQGIDQNRIRTISEGERLANKQHVKEAQFKLDRYVEIVVR